MYVNLKIKDQIKKLDEKKTKMKKEVQETEEREWWDRRKRMVIEMRVGVELEV